MKTMRLNKEDWEVGPIDGNSTSWWDPLRPFCFKKITSNQQKEGELSDQNSSSTQSTGQSYNTTQGGTSVGKTNSNGQRMLTIDSGYRTNANADVGHFTTPSLTGTHYAMQVDSKQSFSSMLQTCIPLPYVDPYYGSISVSNVPQPMVGISPSRVALPNVQQEEPIYVNAKQYDAILRRRQSRAKLEAKNKISKGRKPYLHESRHVHAMKRARGSGGRFLNTKNNCDSTSIPKDNKPSNSSLTESAKFPTDVVSTTSYSDTTTFPTVNMISNSKN